MSSDRLQYLAQHHSGRALEVLGNALRNPDLALRGRALRARGELRAVLHAADATLRALARTPA